MHLSSYIILLNSLTIITPALMKESKIMPLVYIELMSFIDILYGLIEKYNTIKF